MIARNLTLAVAAASLVQLAGCGSARPIADEGGGGTASACTICHGDAARAEAVPLNQAAPPVTASGAGAGAHLAHLRGGAFSAGVACADCHLVPSSASHSDGTVAVTFSARAGAGASYDPGTGTCSGVACHGAGLSGGPAASPPWGSTAGLGCGSCHGAPPPNHPASATTCSTCHPGTVLSNGTIDVPNGMHVNGTVEVDSAHPAGWSDPAQHGYTANRTGLAGCKTCHGTSLTGGSGPSCASCHSAVVASWQTSCTFCHGNPGTGRMSPPVDTQGRSAATNVSVGVHDSHVGTTIAPPISCAECHPSRGDVITDAAHVDGDGQAEVVFGTLARTGGVSPAYARASPASATCASTYCHGNFTGGVNATPNWTSTAQVTCTSCHGNPPNTGRHDLHVNDRGYACERCHSGFSSSTVNASVHLNGTKTVQFLGSGTWNPTGRGTCSSVGCHGTESWR